MRGLKALKIDSSREREFKHSFQGLTDHLRNFGYEVESTVTFFLALSFVHFPLFTNEKNTLFSTSCYLGSKLFGNTDSPQTNILRFVKGSVDKSQNRGILNALMEFILSTSSLG